jgi:hypothetical protein
MLKYKSIIIGVRDKFDGNLPPTPFMVDRSGYKYLITNYDRDSNYIIMSDISSGISYKESCSYVKDLIKSNYLKLVMFEIIIKQ